MTVEPSNTMSEELEFDSKKLQVGDRIYYIDMKENKNGRFIKLVEGLGYGRMSRIVVPLSIAASFVAKLKENNEFNVNNPQSETSKKIPAAVNNSDERNDDFPTIIHSSNLFIQNRRFYFDLREHKDGYRRLKISYVMKAKRINLSVVTDALPHLVEIMEDYIERFSDETTEQESALVTLKVETTTNPNSSPRERSKRSSIRDETVIKPKPRKPSLVVSELPAPVKQQVVNKVYSLELVTGEQNAFIRMTELIGASKKSTFHVPLEGCTAWKDAIVKFVDEITPEDISNANALRLAAEAANASLHAEKAT